MPEVTAAQVQALRGKTGLPMMDCKKALQATQGDMEGAVKWLREQGIKTQETRLGRDTSAGRIAVVGDLAQGVGAMIELNCESAPVANSPEFKQYCQDLVRQLADNPKVSTPDELLACASLRVKGKTLADEKDDMFNRIREVFNLRRIVRFAKPCGAYAHHDGSMGALVVVEGGDAETAKDVAMHVTAQNPAVVRKEDLDPAVVDNERQILTTAAKAEGKPDNIIAKMVEGRLRNFYAAQVLLEQPFVKDDTTTVGKLVGGKKMQVLEFVRWEVGK